MHSKAAGISTSAKPGKKKYHNWTFTINYKMFCVLQAEWLLRPSISGCVVGVFSQVLVTVSNTLIMLQYSSLLEWKGPKRSARPPNTYIFVPMMVAEWKSLHRAGVPLEQKANKQDFIHKSQRNQWQLNKNIYLNPCSIFFSEFWMWSLTFCRCFKPFSAKQHHLVVRVANRKHKAHELIVMSTWSCL